MATHWEKSEAQNEKIRTHWFLHSIIGYRAVPYSGDYVSYDEEGFFGFAFRMDEVIKSSGNPISPADVEEIVYDRGLARLVIAFGNLKLHVMRCFFDVELCVRKHPVFDRPSGFCASSIKW